MASLPLLLVLAYHAEILTIGSESLAYRFFFSYRILNGESRNIWFLQGYLLSAAQNSLLVLSGADKVDGSGLRWALNFFSLGSLALNTAVLAAAAAVVSFTRGITWTDRVMFAIIGLGPMYATSGQGFQHSLWPDYYHLNVAISALGLALFQVAWRRPELGRHAIWVFAAGLFAGLAAANKITAGVCGAALILVLVFRPSTRIWDVIARALLAGVGIIVGCAWPVLAFYRFNFPVASEAFRAWFAYMKNPGGDEGFYSQLSWYLIANHLALFACLYLVSLVLSAIELTRRPERVARIVLVAMTVLGMGLIYSVIKRPAGTSLFEAAVFVGCFGAIMLTVLPASRSRTTFVAVLGMAFLFFSTARFPWKSQIYSITASKAQAEARWTAFHVTNEKAQGRRVIFFIPDNRYHAQDLFVVLLKGTADMGSWDVSARGRPTLERFAPGLEFRSTHSIAPPKEAGGKVYIWNDTPGLPPVESFFPELETALRQNGAKVQEIDLKTGQHFSLLEVNE